MNARHTLLPILSALLLANCADEKQITYPALCDGVECPDGQICENNTCVPKDNPKPDACDPECTDGKICKNGECTEPEPPDPNACDPECTDGKICKNGECTEPETPDPNVCNPKCPEGKTCENGECKDIVCEAEKTLCGNECVDTQTNVKHCGECGHSCDTDVPCDNGVCVPEGTCMPNALAPDEDNDGDGIKNIMELNSQGFEDPCNPDTDGDTIPDGFEDFNHNGIYEERFGETMPNDPSSKPNQDAYDLMQIVCKADDILNGPKTELKGIHIAQLKGAVYADKKADTKDVTVFSDKAHKVVGFFGSLSQKPYTGLQLLKTSTLKDGNYAEESNFTNAVPLESWLENKTEAGAPIYDQTNLQVVPDHTITRYKYLITLENNQTLEDIRDKIAKVFDENLEVGEANSSTSCSDASNPEDQGKAILYLARSEYKEGNAAVYAYSGALACRDTLTMSKTDSANALEAMNMLEDIISGTLIAPKALPLAPTYEPFRDFVCQTEEFGTVTGAVDFLWVIDNSGSMEDEQTNLTSTIKAFTKELEATNIDYRLAVTTTDAYLLDETGVVNGDKYSYDSQEGGIYTPFELDSVNNTLGTDLKKTTQNSYTATYLNYLGIHSAVQQLSCFIDKDAQEGVSTFIQNVAGKAGKPNIKGKGYEDGLKSGALALERLGLFVGTDTNPKDIKDELLYTIQDKELFATLKRKTAYGSPKLYESCEDSPSNATCSYRMPTCNLRENALKYIIWVSDEESRQFKEDEDATGSLLSKSDAHLYGCRTGYKLANVTMKTGHSEGNEAECNPSMAKTLEDLIQNAKLTSDMSLEDIKASAPEYYAMLEYYLNIYRRYAGENDVTGFALVGDIGVKNGGICTPLKICEGKCIDKDGNQDLTSNGQHGIGCFQCEGKYKDSAAAIIGADYGLSYIHMARFLSNKKEGGFASICNPNLESSIHTIFEDVAGRVAAHPLKGYPIASTIRVAVKSDGKTKELTRGASKDGWFYDASQNAIIFNGVNIKKEDYIAISYTIWKKTVG